MNPPSVVDSILSARYLRKGEKNFTDICRRVASALADDETERARFYEAMISLRFLPNSPTLMNAGTEIGQLSACFTLPVPDTIDGIFDAMKEGAIIHKTGGGPGITSRASGRKALLSSPRMALHRAPSRSCGSSMRPPT